MYLITMKYENRPRKKTLTITDSNKNDFTGEFEPVFCSRANLPKLAVLIGNKPINGRNFFYNKIKQTRYKDGGVSEGAFKILYSSKSAHTHEVSERVYIKSGRLQTTK